MKRNNTFYFAKDPLADGAEFAMARLVNKRIRLWREKNGEVVMCFDRPKEEGDVHSPPNVFINKRVTKSQIRLSDEAMRTVVALWFGLLDNHIELPFIHDRKKP